MPKRSFLVRVDVFWDDYGDVIDELVLEDSGVLDCLKDGVEVSLAKNDLGQMEYFPAYLVNVGIRSHEFTYDDQTIFNNIDYFKKCFERGLSAYKALLFLHDTLKEDGHES